MLRTHMNPVSEPKTNKEVKAEQPAPETQPDRSAYNCPECSGEGLISQDKLCSSCDGSGKLKSEFSGMPKGTIIIMKQGYFKVGDNGTLIQTDINKKE